MSWTGVAGTLALLLVASAVTVPTAFGQAAQTDVLDWDARWNNYVQRTFSWQRISIVAAETAFDQTFQLRRCGRPPYCFPDDFGASVFRRTARNTLELGAGELFRQDLRRRPSGLQGFHRRVAFALLHAPLARNGDGDWEPAYARYIGTLGGVAVTTAWRGRPLTGERLSREFGWAVTSYFEDALMTEFEPDIHRTAWRVGRKVKNGVTALFRMPPP